MPPRHDGPQRRSRQSDRRFRRLEMARHSAPESSKPRQDDSQVGEGGAQRRRRSVHDPANSRRAELPHRLILVRIEGYDPRHGRGGVGANRPGSRFLVISLICGFDLLLWGIIFPVFRSGNCARKWLIERYILVLVRAETEVFPCIFPWNSESRAGEATISAATTGGRTGRAEQQRDHPERGFRQAPAPDNSTTPPRAIDPRHHPAPAASDRGGRRRAARRWPAGRRGCRGRNAPESPASSPIRAAAPG